MDRSRRIAVIGTGTWGIALARMLAVNGHDVAAWSAIPAEIERLKTTHTHQNLPGVEFPESIYFTTDMEEACKDRDVLVFAVPSVFVRSTAEKAAPFIPDGQIIVDVAKGIEPDTLMTMTEIIEDVMKKMRPEISVRLVALSGPTHAEEVARDMVTTIVSASKDSEAAHIVQEIFSNSVMRVYTNSDVKGVEICGAMKNIMALASGVAMGMGYGDNMKAAIMTRGLAEITRLGRAMGCDERTFAGLAGIGDLIVTATSVHSRNNRCGNLIGQGKSVKEAIEEVGMVVEGINAVPAAMELSKKYNVELPITEAVSRVVFNDESPSQLLQSLMDRTFTDEIY
ncbi:MAG: NAD(P)-dependent glycerol-3-phosphate dehydrogenase [Parasporobacterium sp.]|nr:NAD(P)-dependent glycerol-3-phosphate dehydrogenase [Parasporobacterium sp.]